MRFGVASGTGKGWSNGLAGAAAAANPFDRPFSVPEATPKRADVKPFEYDEVGPKIPNYRPRGGQGQPFTKLQRPLPAEESMKHMVVPKGFHVELFADETLFGSPWRPG